MHVSAIVNRKWRSGSFIFQEAKARKKDVVARTDKWENLEKTIGKTCYLSQCGFALEEFRVLAALWWVEFGVEESTAVGDGLQGGRTLVGEGQTYKQLNK